MYRTLDFFLNYVFNGESTWTLVDYKKLTSCFTNVLHYYCINNFSHSLIREWLFLFK